MTAITRNPTNPNPLHPNKFQLNFSRAPNIQYFCQTVSVPGVSTSEIPVQNPFVELYAPGEKPIYDVLNITFIVDEEMKAWREIHDWIRAMTFPYSYDEYKNMSNLNTYTQEVQTGRPQYSDATLTLLTSANNPVCNFKFYDLFPISISSFVVSSTDSPENIITADATFRYTLYDLTFPA
jgi:hypothetical protein